MNGKTARNIGIPIGLAISIGLTALGGGRWLGELSAQDEDQTRRLQVLEGRQDKVDEMYTEQRVLKSEVDNLTEAQKEFRQDTKQALKDTKQALNSILRELRRGP